MTYALKIHECNVYLRADDLKIYRGMESVKDSTCIQTDIHTGKSGVSKITRIATYIKLVIILLLAKIMVSISITASVTYRLLNWLQNISLV
jgi:hypothetical protein